MIFSDFFAFPLWSADSFCFFLQEVRYWYATFVFPDNPNPQDILTILADKPGCP
jgi:hypothetical protein